jgi:hypothetical protein
MELLQLSNGKIYVSFCLILEEKNLSEVAVQENLDTCIATIFSI